VNALDLNLPVREDSVCRLFSYKKCEVMLRENLLKILALFVTIW